MNQVNVIGRVGGEVELRHTPSGKAVAELTLAVDDGWGENKKTVWLGVTLWGATAELGKKAVQKGDRLGITGRLSQDEWIDKETGKKQRKTRLVCESMHLLSPKRDSSDGAPSDREGYQQRQQARRSSPGMPPAPATDEAEENEDLPF